MTHLASLYALGPVRGTLRVGDILDGKYRIDALIGEGGMGVVARATQLDLGRAVALKALRPEVLGNAQVVERFTREARAASRVRGPHALQILDVGKVQGGAPYMVMELLQGEDLDHLIRRKGSQRLDIAVWLMIQACSGVADAHRVRVIHRDLKPSNLFLTHRAGGPILKVLDFGISRMSEEASHLTRTMTQLGTPQYMSPEQIERPKAVDHRTDIWALGCIFHRLLTAHTAFKGQGVQLVSAVIKNQRKKPSELVPGIPREVDAIVDRCLAPRPEDRYQTAEELAVALRALCLEDLSDSVPVITPLPEDENTHTTVDVAVEVEHTLALLPESVRSRTIAMSPPAQSSHPPTARTQFSRTTTARSRSMTGFLAVSALAAVTAGFLLFALAVPRVMGSQARTEAAGAGLSLTYADARTSWSGVTLSNVTLADASAHGTPLRAGSLVLPFAGDEIVLRDVVVSLDASGPADALSRLTLVGRRSVRAESVQLTLTHDQLTVFATDASVGVETGEVGAPPHVHVAAPHVDVRMLGLSAEGLRGTLDGTLDTATFSATAPGASDGALTIAGSFDRAGYHASLRAPRQRVGKDVLVLGGGFATKDAPELSLVVDVSGDGSSAQGNAHLLALGVAASGQGLADLDVDLRFATREHALVVESGKARFGPFTLTPAGSLVDKGALSIDLSLDSQETPCADLLHARAEKTPVLSGTNVPAFFALPGVPTSKGAAHVALAMNKEAHTPLTITLTDADVCNLHAFE